MTVIWTVLFIIVTGWMMTSTAIAVILSNAYERLSKELEDTFIFIDQLTDKIIAEQSLIENLKKEITTLQLKLKNGGALTNKSKEELPPFDDNYWTEERANQIDKEYHHDKPDDFYADIDYDHDW